jgi:tight adherence protein C
MDLITIVIAIVVFGFIAAMVFAFMPVSDPNAIQDKLRSMAQNPDTIDLTELELSKPFSERIIKPIADNMGRLARMITPVEVINSTQRKIVSAGMKTNPAAIVGFQVLMAIALPAIILSIGIVDKLGPLKGVGLALFAGILGYMMPNVWLSSKVGARRDEITRGLPDALDLLTISVEAGLGFDMALSKVVEKTGGPLSYEFARAIYEIRLGKTRRDAMRDMATRADCPDLSQFISALVQADKLGVSIGNILRVQADQMRQKRRQRAEETAQKAPLKMSFVLVFFVLPALLIVLLGPAVINVITELGGGAS